MNVLGSVAKGVKGMGGAVFGPGDGSEAEDAVVEALLQRVADGILSEDRREALVQLKDLLVENPQAQLAVGAMGLPVLCEVLREERDDTDMLSAALECLTNALAHPHSDGPATKEAQAGLINAELFARGRDNVPLLLSLLEEEPVGVPDFYVRYHALQLLSSLAACGSHRLEEAVMGSPLGVVRLMDMLAEREVIRNQALLLLIALTTSNQDIQKIAAFEGAFERLLTIIREEGAGEGGVIVQDCLELLNNLLRTNASNQLMFREMGYLAQVPALLRVQAAPAGEALPRQKAANLLAALETLTLLVAKAPPPRSQAAGGAETAAKAEQERRAANQAALLQHGLLGLLLGLALGDAALPSAAVRAQALACLAELVADSPHSQEQLMGAKVEAGGAGLPALQAALRLALHSKAPTEQAAAERLLHNFCAGNADGQSMLASTLIAVGPSNGHAVEGSSFGGEVVRALGGGASQGGEQLRVSCRAAGVLTHILAGNAACKQRLLSVPLELPRAASAAPAELLMPRCVTYLTAALAPQEGAEGCAAGAVILRLLITWLHDCPPAVTAFLAVPQHLPLLVDVLTGRADANVAGLAAVLLGLCLVYNQNRRRDAAVSAETVVDVITARVGLSSFFTKLDAMRNTEMFAAAAAAADGPSRVTREAAAAAIEGVSGADYRANGHGAGPAPPHSPFDYEFTVFVKQLEGLVRQRVLAAYASPFQVPHEHRTVEGSNDAERLQSSQTLIDTLSREVEELRARNRALAEDVLRLSSSAAAGGSAVGAAATRAEAGGGILASTADSEARAAAEMRASRAEVEVASLREQLARAQGQAGPLRTAADAAQAAVAEARAAQQKSEADLEDLSGAYNALEAHSFQLEGQLRDLRSQLQASPSAAAPAPGSGVSEEEVQKRVEAAAAEAAQEAEDGMNDLLVCLGQEEQKVERLSERLRELGENVDQLLEGVGAGGDEEDGDQ